MSKKDDKMLVKSLYNTSNGLSSIISNIDENTFDKMNIDIDGLKEQCKDISDIDGYMKRYINNEIPENELYNSLPDMLKMQVDMVSSKYMNQNKAAKVLLDDLSKTFVEFEDISVYIDQLDDYQSQYNNEIDKLNDIMYKTIRTNEDDLNILKKTREEKLSNNEDTSDIDEYIKGIERLSNLDDMFKYFYKVKIKKIYLEKPHKIYNNFNRHFIDNKKFSIIGVDTLVNVLDNLFNDIIMAHTITIAFCLYCDKFLDLPNNLADNTFVYYFIRNIHMINVLRETKDENLSKFREDIINLLYNIKQIFE